MKTFGEIRPHHKFSVGDLICRTNNNGLYLALVTDVEPASLFGHDGFITVQVLRSDSTPHMTGKVQIKSVPIALATYCPISENTETIKKL
jgi:hypothetical protein